MYKVRMKTRWQAPGINHKPGDTVDVEDYIGRQLVDSRCADLISISRIETQMIQPPENAMMPKSKPRKR